MSSLRFGIVGTGMIAGVIADAIAKSAEVSLSAVSSRRAANAAAFIQDRPGVASVEGTAALLARPDVDAVYVATPTVAKEAIALAAIAAGKHVLVEKPFASRESVLRMTEAAAAKGVVFMDATHFVHHPRTAAIQAAMSATIGTPRSLHTSFCFPFSGGPNIRFDPAQEPMTALGDLAWYSMRAVVEYLRPEGNITTAVTIPLIDPKSGAIMQAEGLIAFAGGQVSTFDVGYAANTLLMDFQLLGQTGVIEMDDFVLNWNNSFAFQHPDIPTGYTHRSGMATPRDATFTATPSPHAPQVLMLESFARLTAPGQANERARHAASTLQTQHYLDALWNAISK